MKTKVVSVKTKEPNTYEINQYGLNGWKLEVVKDIHIKGIYHHTEYHYNHIQKSYLKKHVSHPENKVFKIFGIRFELWKVIQGYRLSVDTKTTRYIFKPFWYVDKCNVANLV